MEKKEDLEYAWKFKQAYNLNYKHVCTCYTSKKSDNSLSRVSKQVHLSLMEEGRRERAKRRNTRPSMGSMLWWKWVCAHPVDWQI